MRTRTIIIVTAVIFLAGAIRLPMELSLSKEMSDARLLQPPLSLSFREQLTSAGAFAVLGGFRSLLASVYDLRVFLAFEKEPPDFDEMEASYTVIHALQPYQEHYWSFAGWHMTHNAASHYEQRDDLREAIRMKRRSDYIEKGIGILNKGLEVLPDSERIHVELGIIHSGQSRMSRDPNPRKAAHHYQRAFECSGKDHFERLSAYEKVLLDDRALWEEAYEVFKRYYAAGGRGRTPSLLRDLSILEDRLYIPDFQRVVPPPLEGVR